MKECQDLIKFGYNDTAHFSKKKYNRNYWFKKVKYVWTAMGGRSKIRGKTKNMVNSSATKSPGHKGVIRILTP